MCAPLADASATALLPQKRHLAASTRLLMWISNPFSLRRRNEILRVRARIRACMVPSVSIAKRKTTPAMQGVMKVMALWSDFALAMVEDLLESLVARVPEEEKMLEEQENGTLSLLVHIPGEVSSLFHTYNGC